MSAKYRLSRHAMVVNQRTVFHRKIEVSHLVGRFHHAQFLLLSLLRLEHLSLLIANVS